MARSSPPAEFTLLDQLEAGWRDALSHVLAGETAAAEAAVARAGAALSALPPVDELRARMTGEQLIDHAARTERILALHRRLLDASVSERELLRKQIDGLGRGRATLHAYAAQVPEARRACDSVA